MRTLNLPPVVSSFFMVALYNTADHYIFALWLLSFYLFLFPRLISAAGDWIVYHTSTHGVALVRI